MTKKPTEKTDSTPAPTATPTAPAKKKKLSLDIGNVSEVLERKISP